MSDKLKLLLVYFAIFLVTVITIGAMTGLGAACYKSEIAAIILIILSMFAGFVLLLGTGMAGLFIAHHPLALVLSIVAVVPVAVGGCLLAFGTSGTLYYQNLTIKEVQSVDDIPSAYEAGAVDAFHVKDYNIVPKAVGYYLQVVVGYNQKTGVDVDRYYHYALPLVSSNWDKQSKVPVVAFRTLNYKTEGSDLEKKVVPPGDNGYFIVLRKGGNTGNYRNPVEELAGKVPLDSDNVIIVSSRDIPAQTQVKKNVLYAGLITAPILLGILLFMMLIHVTVAVCCIKKDNETFHQYFAVSQ